MLKGIISTSFFPFFTKHSFCRAWDGTQHIMHARQVLYHRANSSVLPNLVSNFLWMAT